MEIHHIRFNSGLRSNSLFSGVRNRRVACDCRQVVCVCYRPSWRQFICLVATLCYTTEI